MTHNLQTDIYKHVLFCKLIQYDMTGEAIWNGSVQKIIITDRIKNKIKLFLKLQSASVISNHNSFQVLFNKIASVYFI